MSDEEHRVTPPDDIKWITGESPLVAYIKAIGSVQTHEWQEWQELSEPMTFAESVAITCKQIGWTW